MARKILCTLTNMCMLEDAEGRVLVLNRLDPDWGGLTFPGGHVEENESFCDAMIREMQEETGLQIRSPKLVGIKSWVQKDGSRYIVLLYRATDYAGELHSSDEGDVRWMTLEEMRSGPMVSGMEYMLEVFLNPNVSEHWFEKHDGVWH